MTKLLAVCLGVIVSWPTTEAFSLADRIGHIPRAFFRFSTSAGKYTIRYDGFVEVYAHERKRVFFLSMAAKGRLERVYFIEHEGDLFLRYDVIGHGAYLVRLEQRNRKQRWFTSLHSAPDQAPRINGDKLIVSDTLAVGKADGRVVNEN